MKVQPTTMISRTIALGHGSWKVIGDSGALWRRPERGSGASGRSRKTAQMLACGWFGVISAHCHTSLREIILSFRGFLAVILSHRCPLESVAPCLLRPVYRHCCECRLCSVCRRSLRASDRPLAASMRAQQRYGGSQPIGQATRHSLTLVNAHCRQRIGVG